MTVYRLLTVTADWAEQSRNKTDRRHARSSGEENNGRRKTDRPGGDGTGSTQAKLKKTRGFKENVGSEESISEQALARTGAEADLREGGGG